MKVSSALIPVLLLALAGCYHYVPASDTLTMGTPVRAHLERPVPVELPDITANRVVQVQGEFVASRPDRLILSAFRIWGDNGFERPLSGETVTLPPDAVGFMEVRRISASRTLLASIGLAAAGYFAQAAIRSAVGGDEGEGTAGPIR